MRKEELDIFVVFFFMLTLASSSFLLMTNKNTYAQQQPPATDLQPEIPQPYTPQNDSSTPPEQALPPVENTDLYMSQSPDPSLQDQSQIQPQGTPSLAPPTSSPIETTDPQITGQQPPITNSQPSTPSSATMQTYSSPPPTTIDTTAPETLIISSIDSANNNTVISNGENTTSTMISFTFAGTDNVAISGFECVTDSTFSDTFVANSADDTFSDGIFSCSNRFTVGNLLPGTHLFQVRSVDSTENKDLEPATFSWNTLALGNAARSVADNQVSQGGGNANSTNATSN